MERFHRIRNKWPIAALVAFYVYLAFHALSGNQGVMRWVDYENDIAKYEARLETAQAERGALEKRVKALQASNLDLDVLDEKSRELVFLSHPNEITIWLDDTQ